MPVYHPIEIGLLAGLLYVGLTGEPAVTASVPARPGRLNELGGEALDPPADGDVINGDAALSQQFLDVAVGQAVAAGTSGPRPKSPQMGTGSQRTPRTPPDVMAPVSLGRDRSTQQCRSGSAIAWIRPRRGRGLSWRSSAEVRADHVHMARHDLMREVPEMTTPHLCSSCKRAGVEAGRDACSGSLTRTR